MPNDIALRWHAGSSSAGSPARTSAGANATRHQFCVSPHQNRRPPDNVFHASAVFLGFPPAWPWNGQINSSFETNWNYTPRCLNVKNARELLSQIWLVMEYVDLKNTAVGRTVWGGGCKETQLSTVMWLCVKRKSSALRGKIPRINLLWRSSSLTINY